MAETTFTPDIDYPGVKRPNTLHYALSWGTQPGRALLSVTLADVRELGRINATDTLTFGDGVNPPVVLKDCQVVDVTAAPDGEYVLEILDRRWRWAFGEISGHYNQLAEQKHSVPLVPFDLHPQGNPPQDPPPPPKGEEPIKPFTRKTAPELAKLLLKAMGEKDGNYDVSALDPTATPTVDWEQANPAQALDQLANDLGCVVTWNPADDRVKIVKRGDGQPLPDTGEFLSDSQSLKARPRPEKIVCYGAPTRYQMRFGLEAVAYDFDDSIRPIDQLSYKPKKGWTTCEPSSFSPMMLFGPGDLPGRRTNFDAMAQAGAYVYRMYRIRIDVGADAPGRVVIPVGSKKKEDVVKRLEQVRLLPFLNQITKDDVGRTSAAAAVCYGRHTPAAEFRVGKAVLHLYEQTTPETVVKVPFSIDAEHQCITFHSYVFAKKPDGKIYPAEIVLECAVEFADAATMAPRRFKRELSLAEGLKTNPAVIVREDVRYWETVIYGDNNVVSKTERNETACKERADYYLTGERRRYELEAAEQKTYQGILPIFPDGACMQVSWQLGTVEPQTTASLNTEHALYLPTYEGRRRTEVLDLGLARRLKENAAVAADMRRRQDDPDPFRAVVRQR